MFRSGGRSLPGFTGKASILSGLPVSQPVICPLYAGASDILILRLRPPARRLLPTLPTSAQAPGEPAILDRLTRSLA